MSPSQHLIISWVLSNLNYQKRRDRIMTTLCGVAPDLDALGLIVDKIRGDETYHYYMTWHRTFGHNVLTMFLFAAAAFFVCDRKWRPALISIVIYLTHIFFDLAGSAGPDGSIWPISPFWPFSSHEFQFDWQWALNDWKNVVIAAVFIAAMIAIAFKKNRTVFELISVQFDHKCVRALNHIFRRKTD
jgi:inner membrane protein